MDYSLLVGVHFKDERQKVLTEGWSLNHKWISYIVIENLNKIMAW
jgi:hypothetical protein